MDEYLYSNLDTSIAVDPILSIWWGPYGARNKFRYQRKRITAILEQAKIDEYAIVEILEVIYRLI